VATRSPRPIPIDASASAMAVTCLTSESYVTRVPESVSRSAVVPGWCDLDQFEKSVRLRHKYNLKPEAQKTATIAAYLDCCLVPVCTAVRVGSR